MSVLAAVFAAGLAWTPHRMLSLMDYKDSQEQQANARRAARVGGRVPKNPLRRRRARTRAWLVVGQLGVLKPAIVDKGRKALLTSNNAPKVRAHAAWAMGEVTRDRTWEEAQPVAELLQSAMEGPLDVDTAYFTVEAFGKAYTPHDHSFDEDLAAARALNTLSANQTEQLPGLYYVVLNRILTFDVAIKLLSDAVQEARQDRGKVIEVYAAALTMVRWMGGKQDQLVTNYGDQRNAINKAFDELLGALDLEEQALTLMVVWSLGNVAEEPLFAELVAEKMAARAHTTNPLVRMVMTWSLNRLRSARPARESLRDGVLRTETDDQILRMLQRVRAHPEEMDAIQQLYDVVPK